MKKDFNDYYILYKNSDESIYEDLSIHIIIELERECEKDLAKYYEFQCWLRRMEEYYFEKKMNPEYL